jgi:hypothetical protein
LITIEPLSRHWMTFLPHHSAERASGRYTVEHFQTVVGSPYSLKILSISSRLLNPEDVYGVPDNLQPVVPLDNRGGTSNTMDTTRRTPEKAFPLELRYACIYILGQPRKHRGVGDTDLRNKLELFVSECFIDPCPAVFYPDPGTVITLMYNRTARAKAKVDPCCNCQWVRPVQLSLSLNCTHYSAPSEV